MNIRFRNIESIALLGLLTFTVDAAEPLSPDADGYIRDWVMLAPIALPRGISAADLILMEQVKGEASLRPKDGDRVSISGQELTWRKVRTSTNYVDFNQLLKKQNDHVAGYIVTYIECDKEMPGMTLAVASNDQGRIYFNGVDIYATTEARPLVLDEDKGRVTLKKGVNVVVFKIINEQNSWQGAMRILDKGGGPAKDLKILDVVGAPTTAKDPVALLHLDSHGFKYDSRTETP